MPKRSPGRLASLYGAMAIALVGCSFDAKPSASPTPTTKTNSNTDPLSGLRAGRGGGAGRTSSSDTDAGPTADAAVEDAARSDASQTTTAPGEREDSGTRNPPDAGKTPTEPKPNSSAGSSAPQAGSAGSDNTPSAGASGSPPAAAGSSAPPDAGAGVDASQPSVLDQLQSLIAAGICLRDPRSCVALCFAVATDCEACYRQEACKNALKACGPQIGMHCAMQVSAGRGP